MLYDKNQEDEFQAKPIMEKIIRFSWFSYKIFQISLMLINCPFWFILHISYVIKLYKFLLVFEALISINFLEAYWL